MKRLTMAVLAALLSLSVASIGLAQEGGAAGGQPAGQAQSSKTPKKSKKKHGKKHKKGKKTPAPAEGSK